MNLLLERFGFGRDSTLGELRMGQQPACFTVEDERRWTKVPGETCIQPGAYRLALRTEGGLHAKYAKRFPEWHRGMLWLLDVPGFEWVYLHCGNDADDSAGCPLLVTTPIVTPEGEFKGSGSVVAYERVYRPVAEAIAEGRESWLVIQEREAA